MLFCLTTILLPLVHRTPRLPCLVEPVFFYREEILQSSDIPYENGTQVSKAVVLINALRVPTERTEASLGRICTRMRNFSLTGLIL